MRWPLLLLALIGCSGPDSDAWIPLARGFRPTGIEAGELVGDRWRVEVGRHVGDGIPVAPGAAEPVRVRIPPASSLRFFTVGVPDDPEASTLRFRVALDGVELYAADQTATEAVHGTWHEIDLPGDETAGGGTCIVELSVEGGTPLAAFLSPVIGPRAPARSHPRSDRRPDVVVFVADTFRADNLAAYGGTHGAAPFLDRLAEESLVFGRAWSPAAWTLPAQASLITGLYPGQHGAVRNELPVDAGLVTLAEHLGAHGYRTGAVTDSGFMGRAFGFDQGFHLFEEHTGRSLRQTLDSGLRFLAADDGRPAFLFVQTYRTHHPYRSGPDEDGTRWEELVAAASELHGSEEQPFLDRQLATRFLETFRALYLESVTGLDTLLEPWVQELRKTGTLTNGLLVFTSDHGEAFAEHEEIKHGGILWEEKIRIPLLLLGPGVTPGRVDFAASLLDLAPTVADVTGVPRLPAWGGTSLLALDADRPVLAFGEELKRYPPHLAVVQGERKILALSDPEGLERGTYIRAFDLAADPGETSGIEGEAWPGVLLQGLAADIAGACVPRAAPSPVTLEGEILDQLENFGYAGSD